jgi:CMP-N,N'-diacetyllegionaminic acid synthase
MSIVCLVPARKGSKGIKNKNLAIVGVHSLVQRAIMSSTGACHVSKCFVSSDSDSILDQVKESGATPHRRPIEFSLDKSTANEVVSEFIRTRLGNSFDIETTIVYLQPTSPFRNRDHVREALALHFQSGQRNIVSVRSASIQLDKLVRLTDSGSLTSFSSDAAATSNRQGLSDSYLQPNGAIYVFKILDFLTQNSFPITGSIPYRMDAISSLDIDLDGDLELAQYLAGVVDERI